MDDEWPEMPDEANIPDEESTSVNESFEYIEEPEEKKPRKKDGRKSANAKKNRKPNKGSFGEGGLGNENYRQRKPKPVEGEGFLRDLRHCLVNPAYQDKTPGEKLARKLYTHKPDRFMAKLDEYEEKERASLSAKTLDSGPDLGHDQAMKVLDRLLEEATR